MAGVLVHRIGSASTRDHALWGYDTIIRFGGANTLDSGEILRPTSGRALLLPPCALASRLAVVQRDLQPDWWASNTREVLGFAEPLLNALKLFAHADETVRSAAMSQVDTLVRANPSHRQLVVNLLSGYLRSPISEGEHDAAEWAVRAALQNALATLLRPDRGGRSDDTWPDLDLDLSDTVLTDFDLSGCRVRNALFTGTRFHRDTSFADARFECVRFDGAAFEGDAVFERVRFSDTVRFDHVTFHDNAVFADSTFGGDARFDVTRFGRRVTFAKSAFRGDVRFSGAEFAGDAVFDQVVLFGLIRLEQARFLDGARFGTAQFHRGPDDHKPWDWGSLLLEREPAGSARHPGRRGTTARMASGMDRPAHPRRAGGRPRPPMGLSSTSAIAGR